MSSSLIFKKFKLNTKIYFGTNSIKKLNYILNSDKILIVSSKKGKIRLLKNSNILKKKNIDFIETIDSYPSLKYVNKILKKSFGKEYKIVIAFGGGSVIDIAKIIKVYLEIKKKISIKNLVKNINNYKIKKKINLIVIPTTSGTGSEVTNFATIWDTKKNKKISLESKYLYPNYALVDPTTTYSLNYKNTLFTAIDALNQLFDSFWNKKSDKKYKIIASKAIQTSIRTLKQIKKNNISKKNRLDLSYVSLISGICIRKTKTSICHSISYPLTSFYNVPHGLAVFFTTLEVYKLVMARNKSYFRILLANTNFSNNQKIINELNYIFKKHKIKNKIKKYIPNFKKIDLLINYMFTKSRFKNFILDINKPTLKNILLKSYE